MLPCDSSQNQEIKSAEAEKISVWRHRARHYPEAFQEAYIRFQSTGDRAVLGTLAAGLLEHHVEEISSEWIAERGEALDFRTDLGSDSITLAEVAFAVEELFDIHMTNKDMASLHTLNDLANFIERSHA